MTLTRWGWVWRWYMVPPGTMLCSIWWRASWPWCKSFLKIFGCAYQIPCAFRRITTAVGPIFFQTRLWGWMNEPQQITIISLLDHNYITRRRCRVDQRLLISLSLRQFTYFLNTAGVIWHLMLLAAVMKDFWETWDGIRWQVLANHGDLQLTKGASTFLRISRKAASWHMAVISAPEYP